MYNGRYSRCFEVYRCSVADAIEVIYRIAELKGTTKEKLERLREEKASERGEFNENLFLVDVQKKN